MSTQTDKRVAIEAAVLAATEELLADGASYAELSVERIAKRAGISRTAFYFYFRDKRQLLMRLTEDVNAQVAAAADLWWRGGGDVRTALAGVAALYQQHAALVRAIVEVSTYDEEIGTFWRAHVARFVAASEERIGGDHATAFALVWMTERSLYQHLVQPGAVDEERLLDALAGVWERAAGA